MEKIEIQNIIEERYEHTLKVSPHSHSIQVQSQNPADYKKSANMLMCEDNLSNKKLEKSQGQNVKKNQAPPMSKQQYDSKCIEIKKRIIFGNVYYGRDNCKRPEKDYCVSAKENSREDQLSRQKEKTEKKNTIYLLNRNGDVKVDFISPESSAPSSFLNKRKDNTRNIKDKDCLDGFKSVSRQFQQKNKQLKVQGSQNQTNKVCVQQLKQKNLLKVSSFRDFLYMQLLPNYQIFVQVKCTKKGIFNSTYKFYFQQTKKFIMACEKQGFTKFVFSSSQSRIDQSHVSHLGNMETNFSGSQFFIYDSGDCSKPRFKEGNKKQLAYVHYFQGQNQAMQLSTLITTGDNQSTGFTVSNKQDNILSNQWAIGHRQGMDELTSKLPGEDNNYCGDKLDFRGLADVASTNNFIVQNTNYPEALIFGRQNKETYLMRVKAPFSLMQAFAICMSSIHYKFV